MDVALSIEHLLPAAEYGGVTQENTQEEYDALRWEDSRPKPTWAQIEAAWIVIEPSFRPAQRERNELSERADDPMHETIWRTIAAMHSSSLQTVKQKVRQAIIDTIPEP